MLIDWPRNWHVGALPWPSLASASTCPAFFPGDAKEQGARAWPGVAARM